MIDNTISTPTMSLVQFRCLPATPTDIDFQPDNTVHIKGFASGLTETSFPEEIMNHILRFDHIVFDGDDLKLDSFTKYIAFLAPRLDHSRQKLVAFKLSGSREILQRSWQRWATIDCSATALTGLRVHRSPPAPQREPLLTREVPIHYFLVPGKPRDFVELGLRAIQHTRAMHVVSFGGGECVIQEFQQGPPGIEWTFFDIPREREGRLEESSLRRLILAHHDPGLVFEGGGGTGKRVEVWRREHPQLWSIRRHDKNHPTEAATASTVIGKLPGGETKTKKG